MESTGEPLKIHVSEESQKLLAKDNTFKLEARGAIEVKVFGSNLVKKY
jgi:hypothetical protein